MWNAAVLFILSLEGLPLFSRRQTTHPSVSGKRARVIGLFFSAFPQRTQRLSVIVFSWGHINRLTNDYQLVH
jgi:hypothetical protein